MNTYEDTTGLLVFSGTPKPNALLAAWLDELAEADKAEECGFRLIEPENTGLTALAHPEVDDMAFVQIKREGESDQRVFCDESFMRASRMALEHAGLRWSDFDQDGDLDQLLEALGEAYGQMEYASSLMQRYSSDDLLDVSVQVEMAMRFSGEHNLCAAMIQSGIHSDKMRLWAFGGYNELVLRMADGSVQTQCFAPRTDMLKAFGEFRQSAAREQGDPIAQHAKPLYVACFGTTDFVNSPTFATFDVDEGMVSELRALQALAMRSGLDEVRFSVRPGFEFSTDDASGGMDTGAMHQWVVSSNGGFMIDALTEDNYHVQTSEMFIDAVEAALRASATVISVPRIAHSEVVFLGEVADSMAQQAEAGVCDWSEKLTGVVEALCQMDPEDAQAYRELLVVSRPLGDRSRP